MGNFINRHHNRWEQTFLAFFVCGSVGVCVDFDHLLCYLIGLSPLDPQANIYGCRLWHVYLLPVSGIILCASITLGIGLLFCLVYYTIRAKSQSNHAISG